MRTVVAERGNVGFECRRRLLASPWWHYNWRKTSCRVHIKKGVDRLELTMNMMIMIIFNLTRLSIWILSISGWFGKYRYDRHFISIQNIQKFTPKCETELKYVEKYNPNKDLQITWQKETAIFIIVTSQAS